MKKVLLLLAEGFEVYEASVFIDVFGWNLVEGDGSTQLFTCALRKEIKSSFNQRFIVDYVVDDIDVNHFDALAIPGGFGVYNFYDDAYAPQFLEIIRAFRAKQSAIASICVGALPLAQSGVLKGKKGTTYKNPVRRQTLKDCGVTVLDQPMVEDDNLITSWNPATAMDVAIRLLEKLTSTENAQAVRKLMGF